MSKVDYVRERLNANPEEHTCHWPSCSKKIPPAVFMCKAHWFTLPASLRNKVWRAFRPGQEISKTPSPEYMEVYQEVMEWIKANTK